MKEETKNKIMPILVTVGVAIVVISIPAFLMLDYMDMQWEIDYLKDELDKKGNVTDDYEQGWLDCLEALHDIRWRMENITSQMAFVNPEFR